MAQSTPAPRRALFVLRGGTDAVPAAEPATVPLVRDVPASPGTEPVPVPPAVVPMTVPERAALAGKHWASTAANGAGQLWLHPDRLGHSLYHGKPGSLAEHRAYIKSREWVPPDLDGKAAKFIGGSGVVYHLLIARPLKAACLMVSAAAERPLRLAGLIALVLVFAIAVVPHIPLT